MNKTVYPNYEIAERIEKLIRESELHYQQVADAVGVGRTTVFNWVLGSTQPRATHIVGLCKLFDVSCNWLLTGKE